MRLELGESHFDRVEIGTVGRQDENPCAFCPDCRLSGRAFVGGEIVEDDTHANLIKRGGKYARLWNRQTNLLEE